jgi:hypothetical protein
LRSNHPVIGFSNWIKLGYSDIASEEDIIEKNGLSYVEIRIDLIVGAGFGEDAADSGSSAFNIPHL